MQSGFAHLGFMTASGIAKTVLLVHADVPVRKRLANDFATLGYDVWTTVDPQEGAALLEARQPRLVVCYDDLHRPWTRLLRAARRCRLATPMVIVTSYGSVSGAVRAVRAGACGYFESPVAAHRILEHLDSDDVAAASAPVHRPSLSRSRWEYLNHALDTHGSVAGAARGLGLDRRSLRRMLTKYPPQR
jgi:two-component system, response regulator RegA